MKFRLIFKQGLVVIAEISGVRDFPPPTIEISTAEDVITCEQVIERLTGLRVHVVVDRDPV